MRIALDYDDTITRDVEAWMYFIDLFKARGHEITIVTMRSEEEALSIHHEILKRCKVIATARHAKLKFCNELGRFFDVWIDDNPYFIVGDALPMIGQ